MKPYEGHWHERAGRLEVKNISVHVATHVGIDRGTGTAADSMLYTLECLAPSGCDTDLYGWLQADDDALCALRRLLQDESWRISLGHARTRGYGDVRLAAGTTHRRTRDSAPRFNAGSSGAATSATFSIHRLSRSQTLIRLASTSLCRFRPAP